jgi:hypothetical protein
VTELLLRPVNVDVLMELARRIAGEWNKRHRSLQSRVRRIILSGIKL